MGPSLVAHLGRGVKSTRTDIGKINAPAAASGTDQPLAPIEHGRFGTVPGRHLGGVWLNSMPAALAPNDQPAADALPSVIGCLDRDRTALRCNVS